jgi:transcriptional regulator with XRE-family HTH domain
MKSYSTNEALRKLFISEECTQIEMGYKTDTNKNSIHDWLKGKNQLRFDKLEEIADLLGKKAKIVIEDKPIHKFNNGNGATLCKKCSVIISIGFTDDLCCKECIKEQFKNK